MGLYDILQKYKIDYNALAGIIQSLAGCVEINAEKIVRQLDEIYDDDEYQVFVNSQKKED